MKVSEDNETGVVPDFTKENVPDWFCAVPFANLNFYPTGMVGGCREQNIQTTPIGNIQKETWKEIWNGEKLRAWRREFLTGNIKTCAEHIRLRKCHKLPLNQALIPHIELKEYQTQPPLRISPNFNSKCNIECNMCDVWQGKNGVYDGIGFWESAEADLFPGLIELEPWGGEPFVQKDTFKMIDFFGKVNPNAQWTFTTNGQWKFSSALRERFDKIGLRGVNFSIDAITAETYGKIRIKGDFGLVMQTIDDIIAYNEERTKQGRGFNVQINGLIQINNWQEMEGLVRFSESKKINLFIQILYHPHHLSILSLPREERQKILDHYMKMDEHTIDFCHRIITPLRESLQEQGEIDIGALNRGHLRDNPIQLGKSDKVGRRLKNYVRKKLISLIDEKLGS